MSLVLILGSAKMSAQQDPHYTQYMYNMNVINPAYAGSKENLSFGLLYRTQWSGFDGAPKTGTFFGHSPVGNNVGLGLSFITDDIGPAKESNVYGDFSYTLTLSTKMKLALGMKVGATFHNVGLQDLILQQQGDDAFSEDVSGTYLNLGTGAFLYGEKFYLGVSLPNFLGANHLDVNGNKFGSETQHLFATTGYVFDISANTKFKPSAFLKYAFDAPLSFDVNANFLFFEKFEIGASYRLDDSFAGLVNFAITPSLRIGYAYDRITSEIDVVAPASHEFMLLFDLNFPKRISRSPRFF